MAKRLFWLILVLLAFGLVVLSSASSVQATKQFGSSSYYWRHQLLWGVLPGLVLMWAFWKTPYRIWRKLAFPLLFCAFVLMALVFVPALGVHVQGATSWLNVLGYSFQPAELLKFALVVYLAAWLGDRRERLRSWQLGLLPFAVIMGIVGALLLMQPDLGTLGVVLIMAAGVYLVAGAPLKQMGIIGIVALLLVGSFAALSPERWSRITTALNPTADVRGAGWQLNQALIAIGAGGLWGVGLGGSTQTQFGFLPEPMGDSVFAVLVAELGVAGGIATLALFGLLAWFLVAIARRAPDAFGSLVVSGMLMWIMVQALVNMAAITGLGPLTGIPLPFISYGGTALMAMLAGLGIVLNIAEQGGAPRRRTR